MGYVLPTSALNPKETHVLDPSTLSSESPNPCLKIEIGATQTRSTPIPNSGLSARQTLVYHPPMPHNLIRYQHSGDFHFVTFGCYHRPQINLAPIETLM